MIRCYPARRSLFSPSAAVCGSGAWILGSRGRNEAAGKRHPCFILVCFVASLVIGGPVGAASVSQDLAITVTGGSGGSPYSLWSNGPSKSTNFFPIGVWLQSPSHIAEFQGIGINTFVGFWGSLDQTSLTTFASSGMGLIPTQNSVGLTSPQKTAIDGWAQGDEPDNAQPNGTGGYGPCLTSAQIVTSYNSIRANDTTRPVFLNFGQGVSSTTWAGRGSCTGQTTTYYPYAVAGGDLISFDIYPVAEYNGKLELVPNGVDNLKTWIGMSGTSKIIWNFVEGAPIFSGVTPSAAQVTAEVWMSIIHGSQGIMYFVHRFSANGSTLIREDGIFNFPSLVSAVTAINAQVTALAPVLNSPTVANGVSVSIPATTPISTIVKQSGGSTYVFTVAMLNNPGTVTFTLPNIQSGTAQVLGENRQLTVAGGMFQDAFTGYGVHLYQIIAQ
jgi:hypothetical protein